MTATLYDFDDPGAMLTDADRERIRRVRAERTPTLPDLARAAADAVATLAHTLRDCAREVEARGGQRVARGMLDQNRDLAMTALARLLPNMPLPRYAAEGADVMAMFEACRDGYVRESWALRIMQMAAEAPEPGSMPVGEMATTCGGGSDG